MATATPIAQNWLKRIPLDEYNALDAERYSHLKHILTSPRHYQHASDGGEESTPAMVRGDATHAAILEPERFASEYLTYPGATRRGKDWDAWRAKHADAVCITASERELALEMSRAVRSDPLCMRYLERGEAEIAMSWTDPATGIRCKGRLDWITELDGRPVIVGIKTAKASGLRLFTRQACDLGYLMQWAMYREGFHAVTGEWPGEMIEIAVENHAPWDAVVYRICEPVIEAGLERYRSALALLTDCRRTGRWPGQGAGQVVDLRDLPPWAVGGDDGDYETLKFPGVGDES
jgi:hypothetical protein